MSDAKQPPTTAPDPGPRETAAAPPTREKESGRVAFDSRGDPVWEWRTGDGEFARDASTSLVRKLEAQDLSLEATVIARRQGPGSPTVNATRGAGFDPYDSGAAPAAGTRAASRQAPVRPARPAAAGPARGKPGLLQKLQSLLGGKRSSRVR